MKNKAQLDGMPVWFDGKSINEALFCEEFLQTHKIIFTNGAFFTPEGRVTDELPLRGEIFEELAFFNSAVTVLQTLVVALGAGLGIWGAVNLLESYGNGNPGANAHVP